MMIVKVGSDSLEIPEVVDANSLLKIRGLMFRNKESSFPILFDMKSSLHSFFVFFPFLTLWLDEENNVLESRVIKPFSLRENSKSNYSKILEIPINRRYRNIVDHIIPPAHP